MPENRTLHPLPQALGQEVRAATPSTRLDSFRSSHPVKSKEAHSQPRTILPRKAFVPHTAAFRVAERVKSKVRFVYVAPGVPGRARKRGRNGTRTERAHDDMTSVSESNDPNAQDGTEAAPEFHLRPTENDQPSSKEWDHYWRLRNNWSPTALSLGQHSNLNQMAGLPVTKFMSQAISHFVYVHAPTTNPFIYGRHNLEAPVTTLWIPVANGDLAALHAGVAFAALQSLSLGPGARVRIQERKERYSQALQHLDQAIQLVQKKMQDPQEAVSDVSILTVGLLNVVASFDKDPERALSAHHKGMVKLVELRGGIDSLPRDLAHQVSRVDSNCSWLTQDPPHCPMYRSRVRSLLSPPPDFLNVKPYENPQLERFLCKTLFSVAGGLYYMTNVLRGRKNATVMHNLSQDEIEYFEDTYATTNHLLAALPHPKRLKNQSTYYQRQHSWRLAAFFYFNLAIRDSPVPSVLSRSCAWLVDALHAAEMSSWSVQNFDILTWILFMGFCGAAGQDHVQGWFSQELRRMRPVMKIETTKAFTEILERYLYVDTVYAGHVDALWQIIG